MWTRAKLEEDRREPQMRDGLAGGGAFGAIPEAWS